VVINQFDGDFRDLVTGKPFCAYTYSRYRGTAIEPDMYPVIGVIIEAKLVIVSYASRFVPGGLKSPVFGPHMSEVSGTFLRFVGS
jgi:hypothetical protein